MVTEAMRVFGTKTKAKAVRLAMEDAVKRHLRQEGFDAMDAAELDFSEIVSTRISTWLHAFDYLRTGERSSTTTATST